MPSIFTNLASSLRSLGTGGCLMVVALISVLGIGLILLLASALFNFSLFGDPTPAAPVVTPSGSSMPSLAPSVSVPASASPSATSSAPERESTLLPASAVQAFGIDRTTFTANWYMIPPAGIAPVEFLVVVNGETVGTEPYVAPGEYNFAVTDVPCGATFTLQIITMAADGTAAASETYENVTNPC